MFCDERTDTWNVFCDNGLCPVEPGTAICFSEQEAIEAWNTRTDLVCTYIGSNDGGEAWVYEHVFSCGHSCEWVWDNPPRYCPECGARVEK